MSSSSVRRYVAEVGMEREHDIAGDGGDMLKIYRSVLGKSVICR